MFLRSIVRTVNGSMKTNFIIARECKQRAHEIQKAFVKPTRRKFISDQLQYTSELTSKADIPQDWSIVISDVLSKTGEFNEKNVNSVILKMLLHSNNLEKADSFVKHLLKSKEELSLGTTNSVLKYYVQLGLRDKLLKKNAAFIKKTYKSLYKKYKMLDPETCENLACALAISGEIDSALKVLEDVNITSYPTRTAYGVIVASLFKQNRKEEAMDLMRKSMKYYRNIWEEAYKAWVDYIVRNSEDSDGVLRGMEEMQEFISSNCLAISKKVAKIIEEVFVGNLKWQVTDTKVSYNGKCDNCGKKLDLIPLTTKEFNSLQSKFKDQVLIGKDIFLKTSPDELSKFLNFLEETAPYDIVIDALNIFFAFTGRPQQRVDFLLATLRYFLDRNKKILVLGREHMTKWQKRDLDFLKRKTICFFTDNMSQDDPFFLTAALYSGPKTDIITRDKLRGHRHLLEEENLRNIFLRWQWEHQWQYKISQKGLPVIIKPLEFTPYAQKNGEWHLPYETNVANIEDQMNALTSVPANWLCLQPPNK